MTETQSTPGSFTFGNVFGAAVIICGGLITINAFGDINPLALDAVNQQWLRDALFVGLGGFAAQFVYKKGLFASRPK